MKIISLNICIEETATAKVESKNYKRGQFLKSLDAEYVHSTSSPALLTFSQKTANRGALMPFGKLRALQEVPMAGRIDQGALEEEGCNQQNLSVSQIKLDSDEDIARLKYALIAYSNIMTVNEYKQQRDMSIDKIREGLSELPKADKIEFEKRIEEQKQKEDTAKDFQIWQGLFTPGFASAFAPQENGSSLFEESHDENNIKRLYNLWNTASKIIEDRHTRYDNMTRDDQRVVDDIFPVTFAIGKLDQDNNDVQDMRRGLEYAIKGGVDSGAIKAIFVPEEKVGTTKAYVNNDDISILPFTHPEMNIKHTRQKIEKAFYRLNRSQELW